MTQDESDYYLKMKLRLSPQDRVQHYKKAWYFYESSWYMRHNNSYDVQRCNNGKCI